MRSVAGVGLLALVGCNQLFALNPTREFDASMPPDIVPDMPGVRLTWQVASVLSSGAPDPVITFEPIVPAPLVRIATLEGEFEPADYSPGDGRILIPRSYVGTPAEPVTWRLEYTIVDGISAPVPHEVQWAPEDKLGHVTVPLFGRVMRDPLPQDGAYKVDPDGVSSFTSPALVTTGLWTEGTGRVSGTTVESVLYDANWLSGKRANPDPERGDRAFLIDYITSTQGDDLDCRIAVGSVMLDSAEVHAGIPAVQIPGSQWDGGRKKVESGAIDLPLVGRLQNTLGTLHTAVTGVALFGFSPATTMPGLSRPPPPPPRLAPPNGDKCPTEAPPFVPALPLPVMVTLAQCPYSVAPTDGHPGPPLPDAAQPIGLESFPRILHVQLVDPRRVDGVCLNSGMETVVVSDESRAFTLAFPAAIPTAMRLTTPSQGMVALAGDTEGVDVGPPTGVFQLDFTPEPGADLRVDYHDVLLHRFEGSSLITDRIYTVVAPTVRIDDSVLRSGAQYVFEIRSYKGHPAAARGDFAQVDYPYGAAIVFTRTFKTR